MIIDVDPESPVPPYEQIRVQITTLIQAGVLAPGDRLPPIRQLAADLGLATNTVGRAYRELEAAGLVHSMVRRGTTVTDQSTTMSTEQRQAQLAQAAQQYRQTSRLLGVSLEEAILAVRLSDPPPAR